VARSLGVLLAGGRGRRLGLGVPKALVMLGGRTLLARALETLRALCEDVVVVAPAAMPLPLDPALRVADPEPVAGPLGALVAGFSAREFREALVLGVDHPFATPPALAALRALRGSAAAVVPAPGQRAQPLAAWYAPAALAPLAAAHARAERALVPAVLALDPRIVSDERLAAMPGGAAAYANVNTPPELEQAERRLSQGAGR
jgi:molybdopterin-guanine dinucleotide biosynthesis protein A